eukprot:6182618-Pleurochrysis_carterae.AAC.2
MKHFGHPSSHLENKKKLLLPQRKHVQLRPRKLTLPGGVQKTAQLLVRRSILIMIASRRLAFMLSLNIATAMHTPIAKACQRSKT